MKNYQQIATSFQAFLNCVNADEVKCDADGNRWADNHEERIEEIVKRCGPHGGGFDAGTEFSIDSSKPERLVFLTSFHHMTEHGYYDGWTKHKVIVTPSLASDYNFRVTGRNKNDIKEYIAQCFDTFLSGDADQK